MEQDGVGCLAASFYLKKETEPGSENSFFSKSCENEQYQSKINNIWNLIFQTKMV
jgi:hypothetical protein